MTTFNHVPVNLPDIKIEIKMELDCMKLQTETSTHL